MFLRELSEMQLPTENILLFKNGSELEGICGAQNSGYLVIVIFGIRRQKKVKCRGRAGDES